MRFFEITTSMDSKTFNRLFKTKEKNNSADDDFDFFGDDNNVDEKHFAQDMIKKADALWKKNIGDSFIFLVTRQKEKLVLGVVLINEKSKIQTVASGINDAMALAGEFLSSAKITHSALKLEETTLCRMWRMINAAYRNDYLEDDDETGDMLGLSSASSGRTGVSFDEYTDDWESGKFPSRKELIGKVSELFCAESMVPEIERIFQGASQETSHGHPVHYMIRSDSAEMRAKITKLLFTALRVKNRIQNGRYCVSRFDDDENCGRKNYDPLFRVNSGGMIVAEYPKNISGEDGGVAFPGMGGIRAFCEAVKKYKNRVLTVLCLPQTMDRAQEELLGDLAELSIIPIKEQPLFGDFARNYLRAAAKSANITPDKALYSRVNDPEKGWHAADLDREFDHWFTKTLKNRVYPQYGSLNNDAFIRVAGKPKGSAYGELDSLIGLESAKDVIKKAVNHYKAQKIFRERGLKSTDSSMHMIFTGNPGSAKTTVARLFAQIMKENGLLSRGNLVEVGRSDLVGKYVGWTAHIVKQKFAEASGSVLFIDEAYSLVDDRQGLFGDEAINTIVQEMENNRNDMVVIFAGYTDRMDGFLAANPGLRSRIAFHVPFADYSTAELCEILKFMAQKNGMSLSGDVEEKAASIFETAAKSQDFGNGRFVRNIFEKAMMNLSDRLVAMNAEDITDSYVRTLVADDFEMPFGFDKPAVKAIGFI